MKYTFASILLVSLSALFGCASTPNTQREIADPLIRSNRAIFSFNEVVYRRVLEPVAKGWDWLAPDPVQHSLRRGFENLGAPGSASNNLLQGKGRNFGTELARFGINSTLGIAGLFDPASQFGIERHAEDFGQTLATWGVGSGPYFVVPILGPSSPRHLVGMAADSGLSVWPLFVEPGITFGLRSGDLMNTLSLHLKDIQSSRESSFDYYIFVRDAWSQNRHAKTLDDHVPDDEASDESNQEDLYDESLYDDAAN